MPERERLPPQLALSRFLDAVRDEAAVSPGFRNRLVQALGFDVYVEGEEEIQTLDPVSLALSKSEDSFRRIYAQMGAPQLKKVLKDSGLATPSDLAKLTKPMLVEMLWSRSRNRASERGRRS